MESINLKVKKNRLILIEIGFYMGKVVEKLKDMSVFNYLMY